VLVHRACLAGRSVLRRFVCCVLCPCHSHSHRHSHSHSCPHTLTHIVTLTLPIPVPAGTMLDLPYDTRLEKSGALQNWRRTNMRGTSGEASSHGLPRHLGTRQ
jgi:hypothetical protein